MELTDIYVDNAIVRKVGDVLRSTRYVKGEELRRFEQEFADMCDSEYAVGVSSGTAALLVALQVIDVGKEDEVFVPAHTFFATVSPILHLEAEPIFVNIDSDTYTMDPIDLEQQIRNSSNPTAIIPVHIFGQMADMNAIRDIADDHNLTVIEDACQAHFAERDGNIAGCTGEIGCFSFYPSKNMTVGGDGGMLITDEPDTAELARALRNHGRDENGIHRHLGLNFRLDEMKAAVGRIQLQHINKWNDQRRKVAHRYNEKLSGIPEVQTPIEQNGSDHVYHLYVIQVPDRSELRCHLDSQGIQTGIHYETPAHKHPAVKQRIGERTINYAEKFCDKIVSLPIHPRITDPEIRRVCSAIEEHYR